MHYCKNDYQVLHDYFRKEKYNWKNTHFTPLVLLTPNFENKMIEKASV